LVGSNSARCFPKVVDYPTNSVEGKVCRITRTCPGVGPSHSSSCKNLEGAGMRKYHWAAGTLKEQTLLRAIPFLQTVLPSLAPQFQECACIPRDARSRNAFVFYFSMLVSLILSGSHTTFLCVLQSLRAGLRDPEFQLDLQGEMLAAWRRSLSC